MQFEKDNQRLTFNFQTVNAQMVDMISVLQLSEEQRNILSEKLRITSSEFDLKCNEYLK
jgi:hypothetical protein